MAKQNLTPGQVIYMVCHDGQRHPEYHKLKLTYPFFFLLFLSAHSDFTRGEALDAPPHVQRVFDERQTRPFFFFIFFHSPCVTDWGERHQRFRIQPRPRGGSERGLNYVDCTQILPGIVCFYGHSKNPWI